MVWGAFFFVRAFLLLLHLHHRHHLHHHHHLILLLLLILVFYKVLAVANAVRVGGAVSVRRQVVRPRFDWPDGVTHDSVGIVAKVL